MIRENEIVQTIVKKQYTDCISNSLAISPLVCNKLINLTDDAYCNVRLYQQIFSHQPAIMINILRLSNSIQNTDSLTQALAVLGWKNVRGIVSSLCLVNIKKESNQILDIVWQQSCLRTLIARLICLKKDIFFTKPYCIFH